MEEGEMNKFNWTDQKAIAFARLSGQGAYGLYKGCKTIDAKLKRFKRIQVEEEVIKEHEWRNLSIKLGQLLGYDECTEMIVLLTKGKTTADENLTALRFIVGELLLAKSLTNVLKQEES